MWNRQYSRQSRVRKSQKGKCGWLCDIISVSWTATNWNSDKTLFIAFINCYILSSKSPQALEKAIHSRKFIASEFTLMLPLVLYPFPNPISDWILLLNSHKGKNRGHKMSGGHLLCADRSGAETRKIYNKV